MVVPSVSAGEMEWGHVLYIGGSTLRASVEPNLVLLPIASLLFSRSRPPPWASIIPCASYRVNLHPGRRRAKLQNFLACRVPLNDHHLLAAC